MSFAHLYRRVADSFADTDPTVSVVFGSREVAKQINQGAGRANRVVFAPGDEGGALGSYAPVGEPGRNLAMRDGSARRRPMRALWDWKVAGRVYVWAYDGAAHTDELAQWTAMVELHDRVIAEIHRVAAGNYQIRAPRNAAKSVERTFGCETMFVVELSQPVLADSVPRTAGAVTTTDGSTVLGDTGTEPGC